MEKLIEITELINQCYYSCNSLELKVITTDSYLSEAYQVLSKEYNQFVNYSQFISGLVHDNDTIIKNVQIEEEIWKPIFDHPNYSVSTFGNFESHINRLPLKIYICPLNNGKPGYRKVFVDGKLMSLHRLIALTFIPIPDNLSHIPVEDLDVNHGDLNKLNNRVDNLEWMTHRNNMLHLQRMRPIRVSNIIKPTIDIINQLSDDKKHAERINFVLDLLSKWIIDSVIIKTISELWEISDVDSYSYLKDARDYIRSQLQKIQDADLNFYINSDRIKDQAKHLEQNGLHEAASLIIYTLLKSSSMVSNIDTNQFNIDNSISSTLSDVGRKQMSESKIGSKHPKFKGYYIVNGVRYDRTLEIAKELNTSQKQIQRKCYLNKNGFYFEPVQPKVYSIDEKIKSLKHHLSQKIRQSIKGKKYAIDSELYNVIGIDYVSFIEYFEGQFEPWMNSNNYGINSYDINKNWCCDHIIPTWCARTEKEVITLNHFSNLRPFCSYNNFLQKGGYLSTEIDICNLQSRVDVFITISNNGKSHLINLEHHKQKVDDIIKIWMREKN